MANWNDFDIKKTIRDFDFTKKSVMKMNKIINSKDFENMDSDMIFRYLVKEMEIVSFKDYLKRYLYEHSGLECSFGEVENKEYALMIKYSFQMNRAPVSFTPLSRNTTTVINSWLKKDNVSRTTVFVLGFGLKMTDKDVSEFLTKVLKENDFDYQNEEEVIYWYCYHNQLPYASAHRLMEESQNSNLDLNYKEDLWENIGEYPTLFLYDEQQLICYTSYLRKRQIQKKNEKKAKEIFKELYDKSREIIAAVYSDDEEENHQKKIWTKDDILPADLEKMLCSGIPLTTNGNLTKMSASVLSRQFHMKRMSRQRISMIMRDLQPVDRFDLITLLFFIYAMTVEPDWPVERYLQYIDEINDILEQCHMQGIYPVNPYEAFVLMCLVTEEPLETYAEIWERSFQE